MTTPPFGLPADHPILKALAESNGSQFYRCALQVNPYSYTAHHGKDDHGYADEASYNAAMVAALKTHKVQVIAITDHWVARTSASLAAAAEAEGIKVFPGFEANTSDGVHVLCLFAPGAPLSHLDNLSAQICGTIGPPMEGETKEGELDLKELISTVKKENGICIAAHMIHENGLLNLTGGKKKKQCTLPGLLAGCIPGTMDTLKQNHPGHHDVLSGKQPGFKRVHPLALLNANDLSDPAKVSNPEMSCYIKLAEVTPEGLRQAFLDPESRIRLHGEPTRDGHPLGNRHIEVVAAAWTGGPMCGLSMHFNANLNVVIGGRGSGKSSMLETLRYALGVEPRGATALRQHESLAKTMLRDGGRVSVVIRRPVPVDVRYLIERTHGRPSEVRNEQGELIPSTPLELLGQLPEFYSQHEIAELAREADSTYLSEIVRRYEKKPKPDASAKKEALRNELKITRQRIKGIEKKAKDAEEGMGKLRALRVRRQEFEQAGLPEKLALQTQWQREESLFKQATDQLQPLEEAVNKLKTKVPIDRAVLNQEALAGLPNALLLAGLDAGLGEAEAAVTQAVEDLQKVLADVRAKLGQVQIEWKPLRQAADEGLQEQLRALSAANPDEFLKLDKQITELAPVEKEVKALATERKQVEDEREKLLPQWYALLAEERKALDKTAARVSQLLGEGAKATPRHQQPCDLLLNVVRQALQAYGDGGHNEPIIDTLRGAAELTPESLTNACRGGAEVLKSTYGLSQTKADRLAGISHHAIQEMEEVELPSVTDLELNLAESGMRSDWRPIKTLSVGQRATALLRLLLLDSPVPLFIDQPEDDLDNRFIAGDIVPIIKGSKMRRQFVFASHNANVPVLGDADLIVGMEYNDKRILATTRGALETKAIHQVVEKILEGGKEAFARRRTKYDF